METLSHHDFGILFFYEFKLGHNGAEAARNINSAFGENAVSERTVRYCFETFSSGDFSLESEERGRPSTSLNDDDLKVTVENDPRTSVRELAAKFGVSIQTISNHLKAIGKKKKLDKWIPFDLNSDQKMRRMEACMNHLQRHETEPFLHRIITCHEKWILFDHRQRSAQWLDVDEKPKHQPKRTLSSQESNGDCLVECKWSDPPQLS